SPPRPPFRPPPRPPPAPPPFPSTTLFRSAPAQIAATQGAPGARCVPVEVRCPPADRRAPAHRVAPVHLHRSPAETDGPRRCQRRITLQRHRSAGEVQDRKSTRLNPTHVATSEVESYLQDLHV